MKRASNKIVSRKNRGQATVELGLLIPILFLLFLTVVQFIIYLQSRTAAQYAAYTAARAYQVYGDRKLSEIGYRRLRELPYTSGDQSIAEAVAEKVMFESLLWEQKRIAVNGDHSSLDRFYKDGIQQSYNGASASNSGGVVQINFLGCSQSGSGCPQGTGTEVTYCMPIVFPVIDFMFRLVREKNPCRGSREGNSYEGIAIKYQMKFGREPL